MKRSRTFAALLAATALMAFAFGGCGDDDDAETATETTAASATTTTEVKGAATVDVTMAEYAFTSSGPLMAGGTIRLANTGKEFHMMGLGKLKAGKTLEDFTKALQESGPPGGGESEEGGETTTTEGSSSATTATTAASGGQGQGEDEEEDPTAEVVDEVGAPAGIMGPGQSVEVTVPDLAGGDYVMVCFIPTEGPDGVPHFAKGMINQLTVTPEKASEPTADATYKIADGKAVEGPATLTPGKHVIKFEGDADVSKLEPVVVKPDTGKTFRDMDKAFDTFQETLPVGAPDKVPGDLIFGVFDLGEAKSVYLGIDFTAGTYQFSAEDSDSDSKDYKEIITVKVA